MRPGAKSFVSFSAFVIPSCFVAAAVSGSSGPVLALVGLFFVLQFCNRLDADTIRREK
jgi:hypothetical protein